MRDHTDAFGELRKRLAEAERYLAIDELRARCPQLETEMGRPDLWDDADVARKVQTELAAGDGRPRQLRRPVPRGRGHRDALRARPGGGDDSVEPEIEAGVAHVRTRLDAASSGARCSPSRTTR